MKFEKLNVPAMPLHGRHLIEASAGTGKTYNITRLYLRLLLEKQLPVQKILVMTFTNAATEEIRGRLADTLREALAFWTDAEAGTASTQQADPVYQHLYEVCEPRLAIASLRAALLELDDAAVFTIHGFCNKVMSQLAFDSGAPMSQSLATDTREMYLDAASDWLRMQSRHSDNFELLAAQGWHQPEVLLQQFERVARSDITPSVSTEEQVEASIQHYRDAQSDILKPVFDEVREQLLASEPEITDALINKPKKADERESRQQEWEVLLGWLNEKAVAEPPPEIGKFINGNRYRGNDSLKTLFAPLKQLISDVKEIASEMQKSRSQQLAAIPALTLILSGITFIREHVRKQKQRVGVIDFDDLISALAVQVRKPDSAVAQQLRLLYPVALIDEFQDTDANQYAIVDTVYPKASESQCLMMIGDPKQAIYGFRGGDIFTYLQAGKQADFHWVMDTNWRSVAPMVEAYNRLFYGAPVSGEPADVFGFDIHYEPVKSTPHAKAANVPLDDPENGRRAMNYIITESQGDTQPAKAQLQRNLADWVTAEIQRLLSQASLGSRFLLPSDIAILVRSTTEATVIRQSLRKAGVSAVFLSDKTNLFASSQAADIYRVLDGIWHWEHTSRLSASLSSPLFGYTHQQLVDILHHEDDAAWEQLSERVIQLRQMWVQRGCMSVLLYLMQNHYQCVSDQPERALTNYLHLAEVLEREAASHARPDQLLLWLHRQISEPDASVEQVQRLESDATLIQIVTQHGSKGLEYPIVFVPFASDYRDPAKAGQQWASYYQYYDADSQRLNIQLGHSYPVAERVRAEGDAEAMRLLYVAVTRAAHRCYLGVAEFRQHQQSALARALGMTDDTGWEALIDAVTKEGGDHTTRLSASALPAHDADTTHEMPLPDTLTYREFTGTVEEAWRLYSFSALARQQIVVRQSERDAESVTVPDTGASALPPANQALPFRFTFTKGAEAGNLLHDVLEHLDFSDPDWQQDGQEAMHRFGLTDEDKPAFTAWLQETLDMPLADAGITLAELTLPKTLREAEFYFPMINLKWSKLASVLRLHRDELADIALPTPVPALHQYDLEGMMHGFIDLIFEVDGRYYVADYKSTWLGTQFSDYQPASLLRNNQHHLYDLQYLIYALALHRYLSQALPDYDPNLHFGGVYYLYLRGMHPENEHQEGVFYTSLSSELLHALDDAFGTSEALTTGASA
ncbi:exodeoxyribonuclease V subunit beta [Alteromonas antoniana]|uniref:exodeoxyribonuclease V subunit beta n=1 Tax=Alteromonas antoniana TaxID=2803813 RepID=UPI001C47781D|nr:exodeoxyribonuclease V subunit beta [Alteromonas antoniana]